MPSEIIGTRIGTAPVPVSILDFAMAGPGLTARDALAASVELARLVDRRGFTRYWVARNSHKYCFNYRIWNDGLPAPHSIPHFASG